MLSKGRQAELAGISREEWEREEQSSRLMAWEPPQEWEPIPIPPPTAKRMRLEEILKAAFPALGEPATIIHPVSYTHLPLRSPERLIDRLLILSVAEAQP